MKNNKDLSKEIFAQIKYEGKLVENGFLDAKTAGETLIGIDKALRFFIIQEDEKFKEIKFEIPVRIRKGSWVTEFIDNIDEILIKSAILWGSGKYFGSALSEMAKNDFKNLGFKDIFKKSFKSMVWVVKIAKHLGTLTKKKFENLKFKKSNKIVELINKEGNILDVPVEYLELFASCPYDLFINIVQTVEIDRELVFIYRDNETNDNEVVKIDNNVKEIFIPKEDDDEILFPELEHNMYVELEGYITRGNENSNTIGFMYNKHILTCYPDKGNIKDFKKNIFTNCIVKGFIDRMHKKTGEYIEKRPRIRFVEIISNEPNEIQRKLF